MIPVQIIKLSRTSLDFSSAMHSLSTMRMSVQNLMSRVLTLLLLPRTFASWIFKLSSTRLLTAFWGHSQNWFLYTDCEFLVAGPLESHRTQIVLLDIHVEICTVLLQRSQSNEGTRTKFTSIHIVSCIHHTEWLKHNILWDIILTA
jgi:hypothetical protein